MTILLSLLGLGSSCGGNKETTNDNAKPEGKPFVSKNNEGTITGKIAYNGAVPAPKKIDTSADAVCASKNPNLETEENVVKDGKLANVFVYVKDGTLADGTKISDLTWATPTSEVSLDQSGCHYVPHVLGAQVKQKLKITNSDPTQHNIHFTPKVNVEWNQSQANGAPPMTHDFTRAEVLVSVKCNQHPWMKSYVGVLKHPYFAVSGADGSFTIKDVPPGTYTVVAWHEGGAEGIQQTKSVTVAAKGSTTADFAFGAASANGQKSSLEMMPAIEFPMLGRP
jgi:plastocyanin